MDILFYMNFFHWSIDFVIQKKIVVIIFRLLGTPQPRTLYFLVEAKSRVREVYTQTCLHFAKQGMLDTELFGLAVLIGELKTFLIEYERIRMYSLCFCGSAWIRIQCDRDVNIKRRTLMFICAMSVAVVAYTAVIVLSQRQRPTFPKNMKSNFQLVFFYTSLRKSTK